MTVRVHTACDWTGFEAFSVLELQLRSRGIEVVRHGPDLVDPGDDYPQFVLAASVATIVDQDSGVDAFAVVAGSSSAGVVIAANKAAGARAVLAVTLDEAIRARRVDDANVLVLVLDAAAADAVDLVEAFVSAPFGVDPDDVRHVVQVLEFENSRTIAGWQVEFGEAILDEAAGTFDVHQPKAALYDGYGSPAVLQVREVDEAHPGPGEVRLRMKAAGLNPIDVKLRSGRYTVDGPFPRGIGQDVAGIVDEVGEGAQYFDGTPIRTGDAVLGWVDAQGAVREQVVAAGGHLVRKPPALSWDAAGSLQTVALTAEAALTTIGVGVEDVLLVGGATGGVGLVAAQLAMRAGTRVVGTASAEDQEFLTALGVTAVEYGDGLDTRLAAISVGTITAVLDSHGRETAEAGLRFGVAPERIVTIADHAAAGELGITPFGRYLRDPRTLSRLAAQRAAGEIVVPVSSYPLSAVGYAYDRLEIGHVRGKVSIRF